jgi:hypothetical protein
MGLKHLSKQHRLSFSQNEKGSWQAVTITLAAADAETNQKKTNQQDDSVAKHIFPGFQNITQQDRSSCGIETDLRIILVVPKMPVGKNEGWVLAKRSDNRSSGSVANRSSFPGMPIRRCHHATLSSASLWATFYRCTIYLQRDHHPTQGRKAALACLQQPVKTEIEIHDIGKLDSDRAGPLISALQTFQIPRNKFKPDLNEGATIMKGGRTQRQRSRQGVYQNNLAYAFTVIEVSNDLARHPN